MLSAKERIKLQNYLFFGKLLLSENVGPKEGRRRSGLILTKYQTKSKDQNLYTILEFASANLPPSFNM